MYKKYYVYCYCDPRKIYNLTILDYKFEFEPFYIGYGSNNRKEYHLMEYRTSLQYELKDRNRLKLNTIASIINFGVQPLIITLIENLDKYTAQRYEQKFISMIGTKMNVVGVDKRGPLTNLTVGGDGGDTFSGKKHSLETRRKMSLSSKRRIPFNINTLKKMSNSQRARNIIISPEKRKRMLNGLLNMSREARNNISKATKNSVWVFNETLSQHKRINKNELMNYSNNGWSKGFHG